MGRSAWLEELWRSRQGDWRRRGRLGRRTLRLSQLFSRLSREGRALTSMAGLSLLFGLDLGRGESHVLTLGTLALIASALLVSRGYRVTGLSASTSAPARVTVGDALPIGIELANEGPRACEHLRIEPPALARDGRFLELPADVAELPSGARRRVMAKAHFSRRGAHHLAPFRVAALAPLGISQGPALETQETSFLVVPKVARVARVDTVENRRHQPGGVAGASRTGDATDLAGVRPYRPGDPPRDLHARSWARHGTPMVRQYREEYFTRIGLVVDTHLAVRPPEQLEAALSLCAGIVARLCQGEALVDVLVAGDRAERLALGRHLASLERALDVLAAVQSDRGFERERLLARLGPHLDRLSTLLLIALDWDEARAAFVRSVEARGVRASVFLLTNGTAPDPRVRCVPPGAILSGQELVL